MVIALDDLWVDNQAIPLTGASNRLPEMMPHLCASAVPCATRPARLTRQLPPHSPPPPPPPSLLRRRAPLPPGDHDHLPQAA